MGATLGLHDRLRQPELLLRNEYLSAENRILRTKLPTRLRLTDRERITLAEIGKRLGRRALREVACVAKPNTIPYRSQRRAWMDQQIQWSPAIRAGGRLLDPGHRRNRMNWMWPAIRCARLQMW